MCKGAASPDEPPASLIDFPAEEINAWRATVAFYAKDLAQRDLLLNGEMETIIPLSDGNCAICQGKNSRSLQVTDYKRTWSRLSTAAPVYRAALVGRTGSLKPRMDRPGSARWFNRWV